MINTAVNNSIEDPCAIGTHNEPVSQFVSRKALAKYLGVSESLIKKMMKEGILKENIHYNYWFKNGHPRFYLQQIINDLKPKLAQ